jgi:hypothetical protein
MAQDRNEVVLARLCQSERIPCRLRFGRAGFRVSFRSGDRERSAGEVREAGQDPEVFGGKKLILVVGHHPCGVLRLRFARNRYDQFFDNLGDNVLQTCKVALASGEQLLLCQFERNAVGLPSLGIVVSTAATHAPETAPHLTTGAPSVRRSSKAMPALPASDRSSAMSESVCNIAPSEEVNAPDDASIRFQQRNRAVDALACQAQV